MELLILTIVCSFLTILLVSKSIISVFKARRNLDRDSIAFKARDPMYRIIMWYLATVLIYTMVIFLGVIVPAYAPYFDVALDFVIFVAIILWFLKWRLRLEMHIML